MYSDEILLARDIVEMLAIQKGSVFTPMGILSGQNPLQVKIIALSAAFNETLPKKIHVYLDSAASTSAISSSVFSTESGFRLIESMPCSTKNRANSG
jgi:tRNA A37 threonylcarbamoyladenosine dehydratase